MSWQGRLTHLASFSLVIASGRGWKQNVTSTKQKAHYPRRIYRPIDTHNCHTESSQFLLFLLLSYLVSYKPNNQLPPLYLVHLYFAHMLYFLLLSRKCSVFGEIRCLLGYLDFSCDNRGVCINFIITVFSFVVPEVLGSGESGVLWVSWTSSAITGVFTLISLSLLLSSFYVVYCLSPFIRITFPFLPLALAFPLPFPDSWICFLSDIFSQCYISLKHPS